MFKQTKNHANWFRRFEDVSSKIFLATLYVFHVSFLRCYHLSTKKLNDS